MNALLRYLLALGALTIATLVSALPPNEWGVVKLPDQGGSGVIVYSDRNHTYLLTAAHCYNNNPVKIHHPVAQAKTIPHVTKHWMAIDKDKDLALLRMDIGLSPAVVPIASSSNDRKAYSIGYDQMTWPAVKAKATISATGSRVTETLEPPVPGRSGGGLINEKGELIGICQGIDVRTNRGVYASLTCIHRFLSECKHEWLIQGEKRKVETPLLPPLPQEFSRPRQQGT